MAQEERKIGRLGDGTDEVIRALIEVHRRLGPELMESAYEACVCADAVRTLRIHAGIRRPSRVG